MRKKDIPILLVAAFISGIIAFVITNYFLVPSSDRSEKVEVVEPVSAEFKEVDARYFNEESINPTRIIEVGNGNTGSAADNEED